jgi:uncharacterized protein (TIGR00369 family)
MTFWKKNMSIEDMNKIVENTASSHLGIEFLEIGDKSLIARMPVDHRTRQQYGIVHGGANMVLAEAVGSMASLNASDIGFRCVGLEINANHLLGVRKGWVTATASPLYIGISTHVWSIEIKNEAGRLTCMSRFTTGIFKHRIKPPSNDAL